MPGRVRGGVVRRTGDRVGDALEMRTRRVGVDGFVASLRSIFFFWQLSLLRWAVLFFGSCPYSAGLFVPSVQAARLLVFFAYRAALWALFFGQPRRLSVVS